MKLSPDATTEARKEARPRGWRAITPWALRLSLASAYLSAVADRFGLYGAPGSPHVSWGDYEHFLAYTGTLNPYLSDFMVGVAGALATGVEIFVAAMLLVGFRVGSVAILSCALLLVFSFAMALTLGPKAVLDYSVLSAAAASSALATLSSPRKPSL